MQLSLVLPCFNEEANIGKTIRDTAQWMHEDGIDGEIIAVNDGSKDKTGEILQRLQAEISHLRIVEHVENKGYGEAVKSGCDSAEKEYIAFMDSDGQFDPRDFRLLLKHIGEYQVVVGRRRKRADPFKRLLMAKVFGFLVFVALGLWIRDVNCAMKIYPRALWPKIRPRIATGGLFNAELFFRLRREGVPWMQVPVQHFPRSAGVQTGGSVLVILRALKELWLLRRS